MDTPRPVTSPTTGARSPRAANTERNRFAVSSDGFDSAGPSSSTPRAISSRSEKDSSQAMRDSSPVTTDPAETP